MAGDLFPYSTGRGIAVVVAAVRLAMSSLQQNMVDPKPDARTQPTRVHAPIAVLRVRASLLPESKVAADPFWNATSFRVASLTQTGLFP